MASWNGGDRPATVTRDGLVKVGGYVVMDTRGRMYRWRLGKWRRVRGWPPSPARARRARKAKAAGYADGLAGRRCRSLGANYQAGWRAGRERRAEPANRPPII